MNRNLPTFAVAEERNKLSHFTVQGYDLNGVLHAGTNDGEEIYNYIRYGIDHILGFEPLRAAFQLCKANCATWRQEFDYRGNITLSNWALDEYEGEADLVVTKGDGKGSSLFEPVLDNPEVLKNWTDNAIRVGTERCGVTTLHNWLHRNPTIDITNYDTLVLDTQGNEFEILKGMESELPGFKYLCIELSLTPTYHGETPGPVIAEWLRERGFTLDSPQYDHNDWFFVRSDIKPTSDMIYRGKC